MDPGAAAGRGEAHPTDGAEVVTLPEAFGMPRRRYDQLVSQRAEPARVRDATSVLLVRPAPGADAGTEVFLLHRVSQMAFAGGMTVFPGGGLDERDRGRDECGGAVTERELRRSAVRELFEETGVLLAGPSTTAVLDHTGGLADARAALTAGDTDLDTVLAEAGLVLRDDLLSPWARWITPELMPTRYDLRFYLAEVPPGQEPDGETSEAADAGWATPHDALAAWTAGERSLMPPTWAVLGDLDAFGDMASLRSADRDRHVAPVTPVPLLTDDRVRLAVPRRALPGPAVSALDGSAAVSPGASR